MTAKKKPAEKQAPKVEPTITCGDCGKVWPEGTTHCDCGYRL